MEKVNIWDIEGTEFPAGRRTRVILGQNGAMKGSKFCQGYVVVYKGGGIPEHDHETVESYTILKGLSLIHIFRSEEGIRTALEENLRQREQLEQKVTIKGPEVLKDCLLYTSARHCWWIPGTRVCANS